MAQPHDWLSSLAASRQTPAGEQGPPTTLQRRQGPGGLPAVELELPAAGDRGGGAAGAGGGAVEQLLLNTFLEATTPSARARAGQQPGGGALQRGLEITQAEEQGGGGAGGGRERPPLRLQFAATEPAAAQQVEEAARLFEAFWQYHSKAAQAHLHSRMRQRLGSLRQRLALARFDGT